MQGFIVGNYAQRFAEGLTVMAGWVSSGQIRYEETLVEGFDHVIDAFLQLFSGANLGKLLVKVSE